MDDEEIREMIQWVQPHLADRSPFQYTETEKLTMLTLPRRECQPVLLACGH